MLRRAVVLVLGLLLVTGRVWADGDARKATAAEKSFMLKVLGAFDKASAAGPQGWTLESKSDVSASDSVSVGAEKYPMRIDYRRAWQDRARLDASQADMQKYAQQQAKQGPDPALKPLQAESDRLSKLAKQAADRGDMAEFQRIFAQMEPVNQKIAAILEKKGSAMESGIQALEPRDVNADVNLVANVFSQDFYRTPVKEVPVAGVTVYRVEDGGKSNNGWREGSTVAVLGNWTMAKDGSNSILKADPKPGVSHIAVQTILVRVRADKFRARSILETLDWNVLKGLLAE